MSTRVSGRDSAHQVRKPLERIIVETRARSPRVPANTPASLTSMVGPTLHILPTTVRHRMIAR